ncbi:MAG: STAS domain-containing protein [Candidatus Krumholzibacteriia bacterium]
MATRFSPLKLPDPAVFGVRVHGAFGRGDRQRLLDLGKRCLERGKLKLLLDCADLDSLGGSGAGVLAELQQQLQARGGEVVFAAAGPVIQRFLNQKFQGLPLRCFETVEAALSGLGTGLQLLSRDEVEPAPPPARGKDLDQLLDGYESDQAARAPMSGGPPIW